MSWILTCSRCGHGDYHHGDGKGCEAGVQASFGDGGGACGCTHHHENPVSLVRRAIEDEGAMFYMGKIGSGRISAMLTFPGQGLFAAGAEATANEALAALNRELLERKKAP